ncbi:imidazolonepropionase-like domain-containing protein [Streptomyces olivaceiscleroticus]|uniref:Aminodeoxyfutalosine deaminase/Imidazolonepropionase-like composite domain-containing protein n=1 Tax=Streptomyces olivaceiscleroticus TaxID=68245 RepID=A0ABN1BA09_9ACTN
MLTLHHVRAVEAASTADVPAGGPAPGADAVLVSGSRIEAIGRYADLAAEYGDRARVREWDGVLTPGRHEPDGAALLESAYHPDPREAAELGTEPIRGAALAALDMPDTRWGGSARRGLQRLLATGTTSVAGPFTRPSVRTAVSRSGLRDRPIALAPGAPADFTVLAEDSTCLATVLDGRLVFRRR